jgi:hypothetical protein
VNNFNIRVKNNIFTHFFKLFIFNILFNNLINNSNQTTNYLPLRFLKHSIINCIKKEYLRERNKFQIETEKKD